MNQLYVVIFNHDHSTKNEQKVFSAPIGSTWRELQEIFDPTYYYNNLRFFPLGTEIKFKG